MSIEDLRTEYTLHGLLEHEVDPDPLVQFGRWFNAAVDAGLRDPNAMTLATVDGEGRPNARIVLLKGADPDGFRFFTNYHSTKGRELDSRPEAALVFFWSELERQVRVEGSIERLPTDESDRYFASRPRASRIGAWASEQSEPLASREALESRAAEASARFGQDGEVPRPPHWGGYLLRPRRIEFWQGRPARLHDRLLYEREGGGWTLARLAP